MNRRNVIKQISLALAGITLSTTDLYSKNPGKPLSGRKLRYKGVNYDIGTNFAPHQLSVVWDSAIMQRDLRVIKDELHCNTVSIFGRDIQHLCEAAVYASEIGLQPWVQPRLFHASQEEVLQHLTEAAKAVEQLRVQHPSTVLNTGCELSLFTRDIIPGDNVESRIARLSTDWERIPEFNKALRAFLGKAVTAARAHFNGAITYSAGPWEEVDWDLFDIVGMDYYMDKQNRKEYAGNLKAFRQHGKPVVITEFGCCCYTGAAEAGAGGHDIIDWQAAVPVIKAGYVRDEKEQADYIARLLKIYDEEGMDGAFIYVYNNPYLPYSADPKHDLDMAGYSLIKTIPPEPGSAGKSSTWERKAAFHTVAQLFRQL